jgi:ABC-2 type transport system ATP-binding protein
MNPAIRTDGLTKVYPGGVRAVDDLDFNVEEGEVYALLGPNGAGKTTTIRILTTLTQPTSGRAEALGCDVVRDARRLRERIGYSVQEAGVDPNATGQQNLFLYGHYHHLDSETLRRRVAELLQLVDLTQDADRLVRTYSGGMRKRLEIATALIHRPQLLFLDEPTLGLDVQTRVHIWDYIRELNHRDGITIFLTTHYLEEADRLCNRLAIIDHGHIVAIGTPDALKDEIRGDVITLTMPLHEMEGRQSDIERAQKVLTGRPFVKGFHPKGGGLNVYVDHGGSAVPQILRLLEDVGLPVESVALSRPSLDDVFLKHTGRTMRDEHAPWSAQPDVATRGRRRR